MPEGADFTSLDPGPYNGSVNRRITRLVRLGIDEEYGLNQRHFAAGW
jgi:hypothetical protein